jgi:hypothetical protein
MAGETYLRCTVCGAIDSGYRCQVCDENTPREPVAVLPVQELASLRRLRDRVEDDELMSMVESVGRHIIYTDIPTTWYRAMRAYRAALRKEEP